MPIRTVSFSAISEDTITALIARGIREDRTLDFKRTLELSDSGRLDLLKDVTAMANAAGGTLLYGAAEGDGDDAGQIARIEPMQLRLDETELAITNLLRDNVDERIYGVLHRGIPVTGGFAYVIRVPASPRAPHMITLKSNRPRFYMRATTSNDPMNAAQIKEVALRSTSAAELARQFISDRLDAVRKLPATAPAGPALHRARSAALFHAVPLFPPSGGLELGSQTVRALVGHIFPFGRTFPGQLRWALEGLYNETARSHDARRQWLLLSRNGAIEGGIRPALESVQFYEDQSFFGVFQMERSTIACCNQVKILIDAGLIAAPIALAVSLLGVNGSLLGGRAEFVNGDPRSFMHPEVVIEPIIVNDWESELPAALRRLFDVMWQAWGIAQSESYDQQGVWHPRH